MRYLEMIQREIPEVRQRIGKLEKELARHPEGFLLCNRNGDTFKWYHKLSFGTKDRKYIPKSNRALAETLAYNTYLVSLLSDLKQELNALNAYVKTATKGTYDQTSLLLKHPGYSELLNSRFSDQQKELMSWASASYNSNPKHPEHLKIETTTGQKVRSKSEAFIYNALTQNHIPFRYECLWNPDPWTKIYPDFIIRHPVTGLLYIWEHLGLMEKEWYRADFEYKLKAYLAHGFVPGVNLILTGETEDHPLDPQLVAKTILLYFS